MVTSLVADQDVQAVAEFMQTRIAAGRLVSVADRLAAMAPLLWGHYEAESVTALRLTPPPISVEPETPAASSE